jgi:hypothetical protein
MQGKRKQEKGDGEGIIPISNTTKYFSGEEGFLLVRSFGL